MIDVMMVDITALNEIANLKLHSQPIFPVTSIVVVTFIVVLSVVSSSSGSFSGKVEIGGVTTSTVSVFSLQLLSTMIPFFRINSWMSPHM